MQSSMSLLEQGKHLCWNEDALCNNMDWGIVFFLVPLLIEMENLG